MDQSVEELQLDVVRLVAKRNIKSGTTNEEWITELTNLTHCRLDREGFSSIPLLDFLPRVTNLYLQCNCIETMEDLSYLPELRFLTLAENQIFEVKGIKNLTKLGLLDLTTNRIQNLNFLELPKSLIILNISENPCVDSPNFLDDVSANLPNLKSLDGDPIDRSASTDEEEGESDSDDDEENLEEEAIDSMRLEVDDKQNDLFDDLKSNMFETFEKFSFALTENEKHLRNDFDEFTTLIPSPAPFENNSMVTELSEQDISALEKEAADIRDLPRLNSAKKLTPRPPSGTKNRSNRTRNKLPSGGAPVTRVRTPGARPFKRVVK